MCSDRVQQAVVGGTPTNSQSGDEPQADEDVGTQRGELVKPETEKCDVFPADVVQACRQVDKVVVCYPAVYEGAATRKFGRKKRRHAF